MSDKHDRTPVDQAMIDCWRANYGLDKTPHELHAFWHSWAPPGAVLALKAAVDEIDRLRAALTYAEAALPESGDAGRDARGMLVARLEHMQKTGDTWLTVPAVLALMNDCDMLAARERSNLCSGAERQQQEQR